MRSESEGSGGELGAVKSIPARAETKYTVHLRITLDSYPERQLVPHVLSTASNMQLLNQLVVFLGCTSITTAAPFWGVMRQASLTTDLTATISNNIKSAYINH